MIKSRLLLIFILIVFLGVVFLISNGLSKQTNTKSLKVFHPKTMLKITSPVFLEGGLISQKYTCKGENISPPLIIENVPTEAKSLVLIVDDPDAPMGTFTHWLVWNIDPKLKKIEENSTPAGAVVGENDFGQIGYGGPCPPNGIHRYYFKIFALDKVLDLPSGSTRNQLELVIKDHILEQTEIMGRFGQ